MELIWILVWVFVGLFMMLGLVGGFVIYYMIVFKHKVRHYYDLSGTGQYHEGKTYRARKVKKGSRKDYFKLWVPKMKTFLDYYGKKMGRNLYYFAEGPDGYLYNVVLGELDTEKGVLDIEPVNKDVRSFHLSVDADAERDYTKPQKWPLVMQSVTILLALVIIFAGGWFLYEQINAGIEASSSNVETSLNLAEMNKDLIIEQRKFMEELKGGGSGVVPAPE